MKWFKHISTSLDDPFIFDLIDQFGGDGYLVYFGTVEIMAREFDEKTPGICRVSVKFLSKKFQLSVKKLSKVLQFCEKNQKIYVKFENDEIELNCPKLGEMSDEWTQRKLGSKSGVTPKILRHDIDIEEDTDKDKEYVCSEVPKTSEPTTLQNEPPVMEIPLIPKHGIFQIFQKDIDEWEKDFPGIDVHQSLRNLKQWNLSSPNRRKTKAGIRKHITGWLARDQDRSHGNVGKSLMQNNMNAAIEAERILFGGPE